MTAKLPVDRKRVFRMAGAFVGLAVVLGACTHTEEALRIDVPDDYRLRHPIAIQEADRSIVIFVGHARGGLSASQRADVIGLAQLPVLGSLFRSRDFVNNQTELMVLVTPFIVRAVAQKDLSRPDDGFAAATDPQADLLGTINRIYGVPGRAEPAKNYRGTYGFITD